MAKRATRRGGLTESELECLRAVAESGSVVLQRRAGDLRGLGAGEFLPFKPGTYLRLIGLQLLEFSEPLRLVVTPAGADQAAQ